VEHEHTTEAIGGENSGYEPTYRDEFRASFLEGRF